LCQWISAVPRTRLCLAIRVSRRLKSIDVIDVLSDLFILRGVPGHIRSDNGPGFAATAVQEWIGAVCGKTAYITPDSPWENGFIESFNARLRDELLDGEIFYTWAKPRSSSRAGGGITTPSGHIPRSATALLPQRCLCQPSPHGRLRNPAPLHRPCSRWCQDQP
jgi:transposase InsO family protein